MNKINRREKRERKERKIHEVSKKFSINSKESA